MRAFIIIAFCLLSVNLLATDNINIYWQKANTAYQQKNYDTAAYYYEQITAGKPSASEVYYNLGNAYYKLNRIGLAIFNYQRALHINPKDKNIQDNLLLAQSRIPNRIPQVQDIFFLRWWKGLTAASTANTWAVVSLLLFLLLIGYAILNRLGKSPFPLPFQARAGAWVLLSVCIILSFTAAMRKANSHIAVVMNNTNAMDKPNAGKSLSIPEGTTILLTGTTNGNWQEATLPDGKTAWIQKANFIEI
ncbi:hypothetical protein CAP35_07130 [Chitinophagaceae bacterium IBVUCB1]|nr:hypothetical protein CAP35_07130 [Chitinophagaceae bacterium IBVUCB1]